MNKEKAYVAPISALLCILLFFSLFGFMNGYSILNYVLTTSSLTDSLDVHEFSQNMKRDVLDSTDLDEQIPNSQDLEELYDEIFSQEFVEYYVESLFDAAVYGENTYDSQEMYEQLDDNTSDFFDNHTEISYEDRTKLLTEVANMGNDIVEETVKQHKNSEYGRMIENIKDMCTKITVACFVAAFLFAGLLLILYANSGRAVSHIGNCMITSSAVSIILIGVAFALSRTAVSDIFEKEMAVMNFAMDFFGKVLLKIVVFEGEILLIGVVIRVLGAILKRRSRKQSMSAYD